MKTALNVLAVGVCLVWAGAVILGDFARAFGNAPPDTMNGETGMAVIAAVSVVVIAAVVGSRYREGRQAWALAALPFVAVLAGHLFLGQRRASAAATRDHESRSRGRAAEERFRAIPADFTRREAPREYDEILGSILVIDAETQTMVRVDRGYESLDAYCIGGVDGSTLVLWDELGVDGYADDDGRTVEDRFTVVRGERPEGRACGDERYAR